jgi:hypothetical protein
VPGRRRRAIRARVFFAFPAAPLSDDHGTGFFAARVRGQGRGLCAFILPLMQGTGRICWIKAETGQAAAWRETAERVERIAHECLNGSHIVSAREAFLRASTYWKTGQFYLDSKDPRQLEMYKRHLRR